jgi:outer membrane protein TolC
MNYFSICFFSSRATVSAARVGRQALSVLACVALSACASNAINRAPASAHEPWRPTENQASAGLDISPPDLSGFSIPSVSALAQVDSGPDLDASRPLQLPELIDIAQRENPQTRQAWNRARQAALATGMVEATFLPMLSANVIGGYQRTSQPLPLQVGGYRNLDTDISGTVPALALGWLLFDFGQREALLEGASQLSFAANVLFNAAHQKVIRDVTDQFYQYNTARMRTKLAREALANQRKVERAVRDKLDAGVATSIELSLVRQAVAQAKLNLVDNEGLERNAYLGLMSALGVPPTTQLNIAPVQTRALPVATDPITSERMQQALAQRPDLVAAYAAVKAAKANVKAAEAEFLPKVYLGAVAANSRISFDVRGLPGLSQTATSSGVLLGVTMPIFDGGLRQARLRDAEIEVEEAQQALQTQRRDALREMVAAETVLRSALQSFEAATELVATAQTTYDASFDAYRSGVGTLTTVTEATTDLLEARQARADAYNAAMAAAANLAFVMGRMTTPRSSWLRSP